MEKFDLDQILELARTAGKVALEYFGNVGAERKRDRTFVTEADIKIEELVRRRLKELTPDFGILGEEGGLEAGTTSDAPYWVVDPLDGTNAFMCGLPCWGFALGLVDGEQPEFGLVYLPLTDELYYTGVEGRVYRNGKPCAPEAAAPLDNEAVLYVPSDAHRRYTITFPGKIRSLGSAAYHGILTARASTAGVLQGRIRLWDAAAVLAINKAWGIQAGTLDGNPVRISHWQVDKALKEPLFFCHPENFAAVASTIRTL